jgi:hypothetical protein
MITPTQLGAVVRQRLETLARQLSPWGGRLLRAEAEAVEKVIIECNVPQRELPVDDDGNWTAETVGALLWDGALHDCFQRVADACNARIDLERTLARVEEGWNAGREHERKCGEAERKPLVDALKKYMTAMDALYNHNDATRHAVLQYFGTRHYILIDRQTKEVG